VGAVHLAVAAPGIRTVRLSSLLDFDVLIVPKSFGFVYFYRSPSAWVTVAMSAVSIFVLFTPMHDAAHGSVFDVHQIEKDKRDSKRSAAPSSVASHC
jgi:hypothetical protein